MDHPLAPCFLFGVLAIGFVILLGHCAGGAGSLAPKPQSKPAPDYSVPYIFVP